jgi:hypothetical protein
MAYKVNMDNFNRNDWERYANNFADYSIYQTWPYQKVRAELDGQEVSRVLIKDENGHVVTMCQIRIKHFKPLGLRIGYAQQGPLFRAKNGRIACSTEALQGLREAYLGRIVNVLRVVPNACDDEAGRAFAKMLQSAGFDSVLGVQPYRTFVLRVDDSEEDIRKRLRKSFRRDVKYGEKAGIEIKQASSKEFCDILEKLYLLSLQRKKFKGLNPEEFTQTQAALSTPEKMNIVLAYKDGEPVAAHLASNLGDTAVVLLAASNEEGLACGSSYLIWYKGAISALHAGMKWYDLGGIDPINNPTVCQFKSRMGGQEAFHIGAFDAFSSLRAKAMWRIAEKISKLVKR